jgi:ferrous iron transport protein B
VPSIHRQTQPEAEKDPHPHPEKTGIALIGNMNVGKTTLFGRMCGGEGESINIPGSTVSIQRGRLKRDGRKVFDTPGICSIFSGNEDERVCKELLLHHNGKQERTGIVLVADAKNLKRSISLALQYAEFGLPMLISVNMIDEAPSRGISIDYEKLGQKLGLHVKQTIAREGIGIGKLMAGLDALKPAQSRMSYPEWVEEYLDTVAGLLQNDLISPRLIGMLLLTRDSVIEQYIAHRFGPGMHARLRDLAEECRLKQIQSCDILLNSLFNKKAEQIVNEIQVVEPPSKSPLLIKFGDWCTQLSTGIPIALMVLFFMYLFIGSFGATFLVDTINGTIFEGVLIPWSTKLVAPIPSAFIRDLIVDPDFGILPTGIFLALGLVVPVLFCFYIAFGILEDSGYLPRISILLDKLLQRMGLNGKGVIPLTMGFSCVTMALLTTRLLDTDKEKNIASFLLFLAMPCAPLLAVMLVILEGMPIAATLTVFGLIFMQVLVAGTIANKIVPGERSPLFMEIPAMRVPKLPQVVSMSARKTYFFIKEALPVFVLASAGVFFFERIGGLEMLERQAGPFLSRVMGLPQESIQVFIKTMIRRESGAAELEHLSQGYTHLQLVVNLLVMTFIAPCINSVIVLFKERGMQAGAVIIGTVTLYAILVGSIVNHTCRFLGITFT